ncbi:MAG: caspase family protein [Rhizobiales bacterium]|nr:caspase family protein [Hyphomicrobiales bacterium]
MAGNSIAARWRGALVSLAALALAATSATAARAANEPALTLADGGEVRALVIGVNAYRTLPPLGGAVADAQDIAETVRRLGGRDVSLLTDAAADRVSILRAAEDMRLRVKKGDLVVLSIAGHGSLEPERVKGSEPDGMEAVFLLAGFAPSGPQTRERILDKEFIHLIRSFEDKGARVLFVADSCSGGGLARSVDGRSGGVTYRAAPTYKLTNDDLKPISTTADALSTELSFKRSLFLAAVDKQSKSPEVKPPGADAYRGALSYALARAFEGAADADGDEAITVRELFDYVKQVSYQMSDQRQNIVARSAPMDTGRETVVSLTRGVTVLNPKTAPASPTPTSPAPTAPPQPNLSAPPPATPQGGAPSGMAAAPAAPPAGQAATPPIPAPPISGPAPTVKAGPNIRIASLDGQAQRLSGLTPIEQPFDVVAPTQQPDVVWDPNTRDVISAGDVIARNIDRADLPAVVDRMAAVRGVKQLATQAPLTVRLAPDSKVHNRGSRVQLTVDDVGGRAFYLVNVAGDGTVQLLYPVGSDAPVYEKPQFRMEFSAREPFGSDQVVALAAPQKLADLDQALKRLDGRRSAGQLIRVLTRYLQPGARIGSVALYTAP